MDRVREVIASCPGCCTFETLWFKGKVMIPTKKFKQRKDRKVYHDCGSKLPCRLFPRFRGEGNRDEKPNG